MANATTHVIRGRLDWAKVLGTPRMNTFSEEREWSIDITPDAEGRKLIKSLGLNDRLREPKDGRKETFLGFRQREYRTDPKTGEQTRNDPVTVKDAAGQTWPDNVLIGNGSIGDIKFQKRDYGPGKKAGVYIRAVRVLKLVPYEVQEFAPLSEDDEFFATGGTDESAAAPETTSGVVVGELDDDVPFDSGN